MPQVSRQDLDNTNAVLTITVTKDELQPAVERELKKFRNKATLKGFRQGHAPMPYIKRMYGPSILNDVMNDLLTNELYEYLRSSGMNVLGQPLPSENQPQYSFKIDNLESEYEVKYDVGFVPAFEIKGLDKDTKYDLLTISNVDELAEEDLKHIRDRAGKQEEVDDEVHEGDILRIKSVELDNDVPKEDGWETTVMFNVDSVTDENLKSRLLVAQKGDVVRFNARSIDKLATEDEAKYRKYILNLPEDDDREVGDMYEGEIETVIRVTRPDMDEAFFQQQFGEEVSDRDGAMDKIREGVKAFYLGRAQALLAREMQRKLIEENAIELPEAFLRRWLTETNREKLTPEEVDAELPNFIQGLRWSLLRDKLKAQFDLEVTEDEIRAAYASRIRGYFQGQANQEIIDTLVDRFMEDGKQVEEIEQEVETEKLFAAMREMVTLVDKPVTSEEFHKLFEELQ